MGGFCSTQYGWNPPFGPVLLCQCQLFAELKLKLTCSWDHQRNPSFPKHGTRDGNCSGSRCLAESSSRKARLLGLASLVIGILLVIGYIVLIVLQLTNKLISDA